MVIQKPDKGNSVVTVDRQDYIKKMDNILSDQKKFTIVNLKDATLLNFAVNQENHVDKAFKKLVESSSMTEESRKLLKPVGSIPGIIHGLRKVHTPDFFYKQLVYKQLYSIL